MSQQIIIEDFLEESFLFGLSAQPTRIKMTDIDFFVSWNGAFWLSATRQV